MRRGGGGQARPRRRHRLRGARGARGGRGAPRPRWGPPPGDGGLRTKTIDPVRYIANSSSGKMGYAVAAAAASRGADVTLVSGPVSLAAPAGVRCGAGRIKPTRCGRIPSPPSATATPPSARLPSRTTPRPTPPITSSRRRASPSRPYGSSGRDILAGSAPCRGAVRGGICRRGPPTCSRTRSAAPVQGRQHDRGQRRVARRLHVWLRHRPRGARLRQWRGAAPLPAKGRGRQQISTASPP